MGNGSFGGWFGKISSSASVIRRSSAEPASDNLVGHGSAMQTSWRKSKADVDDSQWCPWKFYKQSGSVRKGSGSSDCDPRRLLVIWRITLMFSPVILLRN